jgi:alcohol dehydrogenase
MDALTQLLEAYLSRGAQPLTDALALSGLRAVGESLALAYSEPGNEAARTGMSLASLLSGICLANAGLGAVHGLAAPLGALFGVPHGVACAALLGAVLRADLAAVRGTDREVPLRRRLAQAFAALSGAQASNAPEDVDRGLELVRQLQLQLEIPSLSRLGVTARDLPEVVKNARGSSMRTNPVDLSDAQLAEALAAEL